MIFILAAICFAALDVINKKLILKESMFGILFYSAAFTTLFALPFSFKYWTTPCITELFLLFLLGISANMILFFLLKAFSAVDVTALAPYRYIELITSSVIAYMAFQEIPMQNIVWSSIIIIPSTLFIVYSEIRE